MNIILTPPLAFLLYIPLVLVIMWFGKQLAGKTAPNSDLKESTYASGEEAPVENAGPGYEPFFLIAFFFAILHLGMLVIGLGSLRTMEGVYIVGILLALGALLLG